MLIYYIYDMSSIIASLDGHSTGLTADSVLALSLPSSPGRVESQLLDRRSVVFGGLALVLWSSRLEAEDDIRRILADANRLKTVSYKEVSRARLLAVDALARRGNSSAANGMAFYYANENDPKKAKVWFEYTLGLPSATIEDRREAELRLRNMMEKDGRYRMDFTSQDGHILHGVKVEQARTLWRLDYRGVGFYDPAPKYRQSGKEQTIVAGRHPPKGRRKGEEEVLLVVNPRGEYQVHVREVMDVAAGIAERQPQFSNLGLSNETFSY